MKIINEVHRQRDPSYTRQATTEMKSFHHSLQSQYLSRKKTGIRQYDEEYYLTRRKISPFPKL